MSIAQNGIGGRLPGPPCSGTARRSRFIPDDLTAHEKPQLHHVAHDKCMDRNIGFSSKVSNIDTGSSAGNKHSIRLRPDALQKGKIFLERQVFIVVLAYIIWRRG